MSISRISIVEKILVANEAVAASNRTLLDSHGVFALNMMASPGAGKTSVILQTIKQLANEFRIGVVEGDTAPVTIDSDKVMEAGAAAVQINTGGECHLDAVMLSSGLQKLPLDQLDLVIIENVGNLICPAAFPLGAHASVLIASNPRRR
jgi:hydrogenase nickel incorporation protein HypB